MSSKLVSTFELLVQPIIPPAFAPSGIENLLIVQAYFLTISNYNASNTVTAAPLITLRFVTNGVSAPNLPVSFSDRKGAKAIDISPSTPPFVLEAKLDPAKGTSIAGTDTTTFLLQPDLKTILAGVQPYNYELRGYVTIDAPAGTILLLSPETRGTFYRGTFPGLTVVSEESNSLATAEGPLYVF